MDYDLILKCPVLKDIKPDEIKEILNSIHFNIRSYEKDNTILSTGEICKHLMILLQGQVRVEVIDFSDNIVKIEDIDAPRPLAPAFLFGKNNKCPITVIANISAKVLFIPKADVIKLFQEQPIILENYLDVITGRGHFLIQKVKLLTLKNLNQRIAYYVIKNSHILKSKKFTQKELSETLGVERPSLTRAFSKLEQKGILTYNKGQIKILNESALRQILKNYHD